MNLQDAGVVAALPSNSAVPRCPDPRDGQRRFDAASGCPDAHADVDNAQTPIAVQLPFPDLDLRDVHCLIVLSEERHYGRAAARLHMSQPGLSRVVAAFERKIRAPLVIHGYRPVCLTPQGRILVSNGQVLLSQQAATFSALLADRRGLRPASNLSRRSTHPTLRVPDVPVA
jgi:hypothetical protein